MPPSRTHGIDDSVPVIVVHGTTVGTNTVIERTGSRLALLTTEGFRDILGIARLRLDKSFDLFNQRVVPVNPRERVYEVDPEGLTSPVLERQQWSHLPRPSYPLDEGATWSPPKGW